jgi:hypothetical protein
MVKKYGEKIIHVHRHSYPFWFWPFKNKMIEPPKDFDLDFSNDEDGFDKLQ